MTFAPVDFGIARIRLFPNAMLWLYGTANFSTFRTHECEGSLYLYLFVSLCVTILGLTAALCREVRLRIGSGTLLRIA